jgi:hypothetical protein
MKKRPRKESRPCTACGPLGSELKVYYGREETFPPAYASLETIADARQAELQRCRECGNWFLCTDHEGFGGSGNSDHYALARLGGPASKMLTCLHTSDTDWPTMAEAKDVLGWGLFEMAIDCLENRKELIRFWVPEMLHDVAENDSMVSAGNLSAYCYRSPDRARDLLNRLDAITPAPSGRAADTLRTACLDALTEPDPR